MHLPPDNQNLAEQFRQLVLVASNFWQLGSWKAIWHLPPLRVYPGKQSVQDPSAILDVLQRGFKGLHAAAA